MARAKAESPKRNLLACFTWMYQAFCSFTQNHLLSEEDSCTFSNILPSQEKTDVLSQNHYPHALEPISVIQLLQTFHALFPSCSRSLAHKYRRQSEWPTSSCHILLNMRSLYCASLNGTNCTDIFGDDVLDNVTSNGNNSITRILLKLLCPFVSSLMKSSIRSNTLSVSINC